jgi:hypothetical protein
MALKLAVLRYRERMQWAKGGHLVLFSNAIEITDAPQKKPVGVPTGLLITILRTLAPS